MTHPDQDNRYAVYLGGHGEKHSLDEPGLFGLSALKHALEYFDDPDPHVRNRARIAVHSEKQNLGLTHFSQLLDDHPDETRWAQYNLAAALLAKTLPEEAGEQGSIDIAISKLETLIHVPEPENRKQKNHRVGAIKNALLLLHQYKGRDVLPYLANTLADPDKRIRAAAAIQLGSFYPEADLDLRPLVFELLQIGVQDRFVNVREAAARALKNYPDDERAIPLLIPLLTDGGGIVSIYAAEALSAYDDPQVLQSLVEAAQNAARYNSSVNLGLFCRNTFNEKHHAARPALMTLLLDAKRREHTSDIGGVALALSQIDAKEAVPLLVEILTKDSHDSLLAADLITALTKLGTEDALNTVKAEVVRIRKNPDYTKTTRSAVHALMCLYPICPFNEFVMLSQQLIENMKKSDKKSDRQKLRQFLTDINQPELDHLIQELSTL
jgi:HEAT repeat protein